VPGARPAAIPGAPPPSAAIPGAQAPSAPTPPPDGSPSASNPPEPPSSMSAEPEAQSYASQRLSAAMPTIQTTSAVSAATRLTTAKRRTSPRSAGRAARARYQEHIPPSVKNAFASMAKASITRGELLYRDIGSCTGLPWELLAACDWMQCQARPRYSPVHGEKLGTLNADGTVYRTKSEALEQCAHDLVELASSVYDIDLVVPNALSLHDLAYAFAAFRWGGLLKAHHTSPMEFPYSVAGLTAQHMSMRWPRIDEPNTPDKPGARFRMPFGALPVALSLNYRATV